jgi:DNA-binding SARP family transcriptional activator
MTMHTGACPEEPQRPPAHRGRNRSVPSDPEAGDPISPRTTVRTLGRFELAFDGVPVSKLRAGKARSLLQLLLLRSGQVVSREYLYEVLWPDVDPGKSPSSLKVAIHQLRRTFAECQREHGTPEAPTLHVETHPTGYSLGVTDELWVDFNAFDRLVTRASAAAAAGDAKRACELFADALDLYEGPFLPDATDGWAEVQREWLRSCALHAMEYLADYLLQAMKHVEVLDLCRRMLEIEPYREATYRMLILIHGRTGELAQVQRWYRVCTLQLRKELQIAVSPHTQRLYESAIHGELVLHRPVIHSAVS